jgi:hypothetical protein
VKHVIGERSGEVLKEKIGCIALKDHENKKIPPNKLRYVKYHRKLSEVTASAPWISVELLKIKNKEKTETNPLQC